MQGKGGGGETSKANENEKGAIQAVISFILTFE